MKVINTGLKVIMLVVYSLGLPVKYPFQSTRAGGFHLMTRRSVESVIMSILLGYPLGISDKVWQLIASECLPNPNLFLARTTKLYLQKRKLHYME